MSGITSIRRDYGDNVTIVRIISSDNLSTIAASNYILNQAANIIAANEGAFTWQASDFVLVYSSAASGGGWGFFSISANFNSLTPFSFSSTVIGAPVVIGDFAVFQSTSGNLEDLGYLPSNAAKTNVVMANAAVLANHIAVFTDTAGTIDDDATTAINAGNIQAGLSGTAGNLVSFPDTASNGSLKLAAVNNSSNHVVTISNAASIGQDMVVSIPDAGAATASFDVSQSNATALTNKVFVKTITATAAALATSGHVAVMAAPSVTSQFKIMNIRVMYAAAGLSGGSGDRLLNLTDGTIVFNQNGITAALLGTPVYTLWGGTGNPLPGSVSTVSTAGAAIYLVYAGGANDYTTGQIVIEVELAQVTA